MFANVIFGDNLPHLSFEEKRVLEKRINDVFMEECISETGEISKNMIKSVMDRRFPEYTFKIITEKYHPSVRIHIK